jgi:choline dehydrogenase-like flavoprotein
MAQGDPERLQADAVVVGSGAGGGPVAAVLAESGRRALVLEAGPRLERDDFTGDEGEMTARLWKIAATTDAAMTLYAGACVGGSTVINDALCFRPPPEVLDEWRTAHGLGELSDAVWAPFVEQAWTDLHAEPTGRDHLNRNARLLALGARRLGWSASATPRSVRDCVNLGLCNYGCPSNAKQSTLVTYVPRAERAGARVLAGTRVERVRIEGGAVRGVDAVRGDGTRLAIDAPLVCAAAGVLETPALLLRSGIAGRAGQGLQFHSSVHVTARFADPVHGYYGPTMAYAVDELSDVHGHRGPGAMIESVTVHPIVAASALPGFGAAHAEVMAALPFLARALVVIHDRTRGTMTADGVVGYTLVPADVERLRAGMVGAASCYLNAGAEEVILPIHGVAPIRRETELRALLTMPLRPSDFAILYAVHLFGGAAMGGTPAEGACDARGAVFGVRGLHVVDAASLPSATGVNPQVTIIANALRIADGIVRTGA